MIALDTRTGFLTDFPDVKRVADLPSHARPRVEDVVREIRDQHEELDRRVRRMLVVLVLPQWIVTISVLVALALR